MSTPMTDQDLDLDRLEALANNATEGPWEAFAGAVIANVGKCTCYGGSVYGHEQGCGYEIVAEASESDAPFIAASRTAVPALVAEVRRLRAQAKRVKAEAWAEGNLAAYPLQLAVGQFIDNGGDTWGNLDDAYEQASTATNPYQKEDDE